ncbi:hypothetical protein B296_00016166 [Ensete ventricosum]|uniref:Uncharacterized protein n=1 Tax=Ensete ventricosum TaxID=4639 RepID=A0A426ZK02_ENSVE|nr:hypothetical protein B296_00016166 [Ensete ventricosum]
MVLRMGSWPQFSVVPVNVDFRESQRGGRKDREDYRTAVRYFVVYPIMERRDIRVKLAPQDRPISTHVNGTRWLPVVGWFLLIVLTYRRGGWVGAPAGTARKSIRKRAKGGGGHTSLRGPALIVGGALGDDEVDGCRVPRPCGLLESSDRDRCAAGAAGDPADATRRDATLGRQDRGGFGGCGALGRDARVPPRGEKSSRRPMGEQRHRVAVSTSTPPSLSVADPASFIPPLLFPALGNYISQHRLHGEVRGFAMYVVVESQWQ